MENYSWHVPVYVVNGGVATEGHSADLTPGKVGLFDRQNFSVATSSGNGKEFFFAQGRIGGVDWYGNKVTESHKSPFFFGKDVIDIYKVTPKRIQNEEWVLGYNGAQSSVGLTYQKDKPIRFKFEFNGEPAYRFFGGPKTYVVSHTPDKDCSEPCEGGCDDLTADPKVETMKLIDKINNHTELKKFGVRAKLKSSDYSAATPNMEKFQLKVCDAGDSVALQTVQSQYPGKDIVRVSRLGNISTYEFCQPDGTNPSAFTQSGSISLALCGSCESISGSVAVPAQDFYLVERPLSGTESLTDAEEKLAFANAVAAEYAGKTFNSTSDVNASTETITATAHGFSEGQAVVFTVATGDIVSDLTAGTVYYVIAAGLTNNTFRVAETRGGSAVNLTAAVGTTTVTPAGFSFLSNGGGTALVKIAVPSGATVDALSSDIVTFSHTQAAQCELSAPNAISWTSAGSGIRSKRTMKISGLNRPNCESDGNREADLTAILSGVKGIDIETLTTIAGDACADDYTVEQWSNDCFDEGCLLSNVTFTYDELPAFEGRSWELVPESVTAGDGDKYGIEVTAGYVDIQFGNCSFDPTDYYEVMPVKMEISLLVEDGSSCDHKTLPTISQTKYGQISRASGEWVVREATAKLDAYQKDQDQFSLNPRMREAFDMNILNQVDRNAFYNIYYVTYYASYGSRTTFRKGEQEKFTTLFCVKENDPVAAELESKILDVLTAKSADKVTMRVID
jgi:hypothetical protein